MRNFMEMLRAKWAEGKFVCVGLDSESEKVPRLAGGVPEFNKRIIEETRSFVCAYKPNIAFYADRGIAGIQDLTETVLIIKTQAPDVPIILDVKRADIGNTNRGYVAEAFDIIGADAVTVNPYFGAEALQPFLERKEKGVIVLCRTSNKGAAEFQNRSVFVEKDEVVYDGVPREVLDEDPMLNPTMWAVPLYQLVAHNVARKWKTNGNCALVVGATAPEELGFVRKI
ncbi:MAG: orotidine-5'-phosphate decarboxylase, partial [bacterium]|nr:orotidine-5'-phosphate decarboxylase [bacterium]